MLTKVLPFNVELQNYLGPPPYYSLQNCSIMLTYTFLIGRIRKLVPICTFPYHTFISCNIRINHNLYKSHFFIKFGTLFASLLCALTHHNGVVLPQGGILKGEWRGRVFNHPSYSRIYYSLILISK